MSEKISLFLLVFAILFLIKEGFMLYRAYKIEKLEITSQRLLGIGLSISYIITIIFTGLGF